MNENEISNARYQALDIINAALYQVERIKDDLNSYERHMSESHIPADTVMWNIKFVKKSLEENVAKMKNVIEDAEKFLENFQRGGGNI